MANKNNVSVGKPLLAGSVYRAPVGTALPTTASAALNNAFQSVGYISEDGVTWSYSAESEQYRAWGGDIVLEEATEVNDTAQFTMIETMNVEAAKAYWGNSAVTATATSMTINVGDPDTTRFSWVIDILLRGGGIRRIVAPEAYVAERGDITYADDELVGYDITLQAGKDSSGYYHYEYVQLPS